MTTYLRLGGTQRTGKSTLVPHLIVAIRRHLPHARILVVDADPGQRTTALLGGTSRRTLAQLHTRYYNVLRHGLGRSSSTCDTIAARLIVREALFTTSNCDLLTTGGWDGAAKMGPVQDLLERALATVSAQYDLVIVDHPAEGNHITFAATLPVDALLLVTTPHPLSVQHALHSASRNKRHGITDGQCWLVLNRMCAGDGIASVVRMLLPPQAPVELAAILPESPALRAMSRTQQSPVLLGSSDPWMRGVMDLGMRMAQWITALPVRQQREIEETRG